MTGDDDYSSVEFLTTAERLAENLQGDARAEVVSILAARYAKLGKHLERSEAFKRTL